MPDITRVNRIQIMLKVIMLSLVLLSTAASANNASWYGGQFHGRTTASGEKYNMNSLTAAHMSLPFGSKVQVTNLDNKKTVVVKINDRGNFAKYGRVIDLSRKASQLIDCGLCKVSIKVLSKGNGKYSRN